MSWFGSFLPYDLIEQHYSLLVTIAAILVPALGFVFYRKYSQWNTYESINDNELLKAKLEAARKKQQEKYNQFVEENAEKLKEMTESLEELKKSQSNENNHKKRDGESLLSDRDYFPLMGAGFGSTYKPEKKRGKCGGGGCG